MTLEEYNQLSYNNEHCAGTHNEKASQCLFTQPTQCLK